MFSPLIASFSFFPGDLTNKAEVVAALAGCWCIIHVASPSPTSRNAELFQRVNVGGTGVLIAACRELGVQRFVHTSSASVVFDGRDQRNFDESAPKPIAAMDAYTKSKWDAEVVALGASDDKLWTTAIRPHGIFGSRDPHFLPVLAQTGAKGKSKFQIGDGANLVDFTYVENVAYAHALAACQLKAGGPINGQAYFITNREPMFFWEFITRMQRAWGYVQPFIPLPVHMVKPIAAVNENAGMPLGPSFTKQAINYSGSAHYYSSARAVREMGYQPPIDMDEAIRRSLNYYWDLRNKSPAAVAKRADAAKKAQSKPTPIVTPGFIGSKLGKVTFAVIAILLLLWLTGNYKLFFGLLGMVVAYGWTVWADSFGAAAVMFTPIGVTDGDLNKVILITGANRGLGFHTAVDLLERGYGKKSGEIILTCRDASKAADVSAALTKQFPGANIRTFVLDLTSFQSVRELVASLKSAGIVLDVLIHNAGAMVEPSLTVDGHDAQFQGNFLAHVLLSNLLIAGGQLAPAARIVNVSSTMHRWIGTVWGADWSDAQMTNDRSQYARLPMYCRTKLAQILYAAAQQRAFNAEANAARLKDASSPLCNRRTNVCVNPGAVATDFIHHFIPASLARSIEPMLMALIEKTPKQGVQAIVYAAVARELDNVGGVYVDNCGVCLPSAVAADEELQNQLYNKANQWCAAK